jgi:hypothetical protein
MNQHKVYEFLLSQLTLSDSHRDNLLGRGIPETEIKARGYKSYPYKRRALVSSCVSKFGDLLIGIPGFWKDESGQMQLSGVSGIAIPVRTPKGEIAAVKLRPDNPTDPQSKYVHLSSNPEPNKKTGEVKYPGGTAAKVQVHFPYSNSKFSDGDDLRITEGELKADIATMLSTVYTCSLPGVGLWREAIPYIESLKPGRVIVCYDSDKSNQVSPYSDKPFEVGLHLSEFYKALKDMGVNVVVEDWDKSLGKGIDDVLADGHGAMIRFMEPDEADEFAKKTLTCVSGESAEWVYIIATSRFVNGRTGQELTKEQYKDKFQYLSKKKDVVQKALMSPVFPRIDFPTYEPCKEKILTREDGLSQYNFWRAGKVIPEDGDATPFIEHCKYILPDEKECGYLLDYLAHCVQFPGEKVHWAVLLQGVQGTGKSFFGEVMKMLLGEHNVNYPSNEDMHDKYTDWQKNCQLIVIEELMARGRLELMNKLKPMITQPICIIREMYQASYELPNRYNFLILTNHEDAIIIDEHDRRYCVLWSPAKPKDQKYYSDLFQWIILNAGKVLYHLLSRDLTAFPAKGHAPATLAKKELVRLSATPLKSWIMEGIEGEGWPFMTDVLTTVHLARCIPSYIKGATPNAIGRVLTELKCKQLKQVRLSNGERVRPWSLRRHEIWEGAESATISNEVEKWSAKAEPGGHEDYNPLLDARPI